MWGVRIVVVNVVAAGMMAANKEWQATCPKNDSAPERVTATGVAMKRGRGTKMNGGAGQAKEEGQEGEGEVVVVEVEMSRAATEQRVMDKTWVGRGAPGQERPPNPAWSLTLHASAAALSPIRRATIDHHCIAERRAIDDGDGSLTRTSFTPWTSLFQT